MDIGESNKRQSNFLWGYEDGREGRLTRSQSPDYLRGYDASFKKLGATSPHEGVAGASDNDRQLPGRRPLHDTPVKVAKVPHSKGPQGRPKGVKNYQGPDADEAKRVASGDYWTSTLSPKELWRIKQQALREASLTEDFPVSQSDKADQWKE